MKYGLITFIFITFPVLAQTFLPGTEDIPFMKGLEQVEETASFDSPEERMVLVNAQSTLSSLKIFRFYSETLKNLGWSERKTGIFVRGNDSFSIEIIPDGKNNQIQRNP